MFCNYFDDSWNRLRSLLQCILHCIILLSVLQFACEQNRSVIANVQIDDLWPSRMHAATHILQEKTHACGVLKRHNFLVHVSLGSAETLVRRGGIINHYSIAYSVSNISAKNYRHRLMWVESIVCNISVVFLRHSVCTNTLAIETYLTVIYFQCQFMLDVRNYALLVA